MITLSSVTLMRGTKYLLDDASLSVYEKQKAGIIGRNGCGKSSLFQAILGELAVQKGTVSIPKNLKIAVLKQQTPALQISALDYVTAGDLELMKLYKQKEQALKDNDGERIALIEDKLGIAGAWTINTRAEQLLHGLGFDESEFLKPVKDFSGGMRMRLNLGQALIAPSDLLLLDEPTNHLDLDTILYVQSYLKNYRGTLMCISHDRDFLDSFCSHIISFEGGKLSTYKGNYSAYERLRAEKIKAQKAARKKEEAILSHMQSFVDRFRYKAAKAKQAQSLIKAMEKMKLTAVTAEESPFSFNFPNPERTVEVIASFDDAALGYDDHPNVLNHINLQILRGDRIGLLGRNGQGKSTLIKGLCGIIKPKTGAISLGKDLVLGYFAQHELEMLNPQETVLQHFRKLEPKARENDLRQFLGTFAFQGDMVFSEVKSLSGGEQARLALALIAYQKPNLLVLDEPTNHLDLTMREALALALASYDGALIAVSHDRHLLEAIADKLWLVNQGRVQEFEGTLDDYALLLQKQSRLNAGGASLAKGAGPAGGLGAKDRTKGMGASRLKTGGGQSQLKGKGQKGIANQDRGAGMNGEVLNRSAGKSLEREKGQGCGAREGRSPYPDRGASMNGTHQDRGASMGFEEGNGPGANGRQSSNGGGLYEEDARYANDNSLDCANSKLDHETSGFEEESGPARDSSYATCRLNADSPDRVSTNPDRAMQGFAGANAGSVHLSGSEEVDDQSSTYSAGGFEHKGGFETVRSAQSLKERKRLEAQHRAALRPLKIEIEKIEKAMAGAKQEMDEIDKALTDQDLYQDPKRKSELEKLLVQRASLKAKLDDLEEAWLLKTQEHDDMKQRLQQELM